MAIRTQIPNQCSRGNLHLHAIQNLEAKLREVKADMDQKSQALGVDEMCLRTAQHSWQTVSDRTPRMAESRPRSPNAVHSGGRSSYYGMHESNRNEHLRQQEVYRLDASAENVEGIAKQIREDNVGLMRHCNRTAEDALKKTERAFQNRINEAQIMRKSLAKEVHETDRKIDETKHTVNQTRGQIQALEEPINCTSTCTSWRKNRAEREAIVDPVSAKLSEHQHTLFKSLEALRSHKNAEKSVLNELMHKRSQLKEDLKDKTSALHIDLNCLTHEAGYSGGSPLKNVSQSRLSVAQTLDPNFVPMASTNVAQLRARSIGGTYQPARPSTPLSSRSGRRPSSATYRRPPSPLV